MKHILISIVVAFGSLCFAQDSKNLGPKNIRLKNFSYDVPKFNVGSVGTGMPIVMSVLKQGLVFRRGSVSCNLFTSERALGDKREFIEVKGYKVGSYNGEAGIFLHLSNDTIHFIDDMHMNYPNSGQFRLSATRFFTLNGTQIPNNTLNDGSFLYRDKMLYTFGQPGCQ